MRPQLEVVLVQDDDAVRKTLGMVLRKAGHHVRTANDATTGMDLVLEQVPDVLISEIMLSGKLNGISSAILLQKMHPELRVVLMSGSDEATDLLSHAADQGHTFEVLPMPIEPESFLGALERAQAA